SVIDNFLIKLRHFCRQIDAESEVSLITKNANRNYKCIATALSAILTLNLSSVRAFSADEPLSVRVTASKPSQPFVEDEIDLGGGLIEYLLTGQIRSKLQRRSYVSSVSQNLIKANIPSAVAESGPFTAPYRGPLGVGTVIVNETQGDVYVIRSGGRIQQYHAGIGAIEFARSLMSQRPY
ncbi:hypothetical protein, partial [Methylobacterium sp. WL120]|uniref:hypothetical protein n=1 Tax=Methylobacterium sp. WL120 TaxID=2603887 RepID=UPI001AED40F7